MKRDTKAYRKRVTHPIKPGVARELTFSCYRRFPLLTHDRYLKLLAESIERAIANHHFMLIGFVFMPEHVHLLVFPKKPELDISSLLSAIKKPHSFRVKQIMQEVSDPWLGRLMIRERPGRQVFRFWQEGGGYDRDIESADYLRSALEYIHANPVRRGLCDHPRLWRWSSCYYYHEQTVPDGLPTVHGMHEM